MPTPLERFLQLHESQRRLGPYHLAKKLGEGGFAPVWTAAETHEGQVVQNVAVKLFWFDPADPEKKVYKEAAEEASALCRVRHPSIVRYLTLAVGETEWSRGVLGLVMEHIDGRSLDKHIKDAGKLSPAETMKIGATIAWALSAAHQAGLVHRDVKPANILLAGTEYKLIDFGIAAAEKHGRLHVPLVQREEVSAELSSAESPISSTSRGSITSPPTAGASAEPPVSAPSRGSITSPATLKAKVEPPVSAPSRGSITPPEKGKVSVERAFGGTQGYADPKVFWGERRATASSDIYSLGATLFECLIGHIPAAAKGPVDPQILRGKVAAPSLRNTAAPPELAALVDRMLSLEPEDRPPSAQWIAAEMDRIRGLLKERARTAPPEEIGPFRDLLCFDVADRDVYFGRAGEVATALDLLRTTGLVALIGPVGSGKSSLARAGVLAAVQSEGLGHWPPRWDTVSVIAGQDPRKSIGEALSRLNPPVEDAAAMAPRGLVDLLSDRVQRSSRGVLLLVDQLEQLLSPDIPESESQWVSDFLALLGEQPPPGVRAIVTVRRDLLDGVLGLSRLGKVAVRGSLLVSPITPVVWEEVIDQALSVYGYGFEDEALRKEILAELKETAQAMPLVQFALTQLWRERDRQSKKITRSGYAKIGGLAGALKTHAEEALKSFRETTKMSRRVVRKVLIELTTPEGTRRSRHRSTLCKEEPEADALLRALEEKRLIVTDGEHVTLAHDTLIARWGTLARWVSEAREDRILLENLERDARRHLGDKTAPLWTRRYIYLADHVVARGIFSISPTARDYLKVSRRADLRVRRGVIGLVTLVLALAIGFGVRERQARLRADEYRTEAEKNEAIAAAAQAYAEDKNEQLEQVQADLIDALEESRKLTEAIQQGKVASNKASELLIKQDTTIQKLKKNIEELKKPPPVEPGGAAGLPDSGKSRLGRKSPPMKEPQ